jgi:hypothetical protein
MALATT